MAYDKEMKIKVTLDDAQAKKSVKELEGSIKNLANKQIKIDTVFDDKSLKEYQKLFEKFKNEKFNFKVGVTADAKEVNSLKTKIEDVKKQAKDSPIKISTSIDQKEFNKFKTDLEKSKTENAKINLGVKVNNLGEISELEKQIKELRENTKNDITVRFNIKQDSNILAQGVKATQKVGSQISGAAQYFAGSQVASNIKQITGDNVQVYRQLQDAIADVDKTVGFAGGGVDKFKNQIFTLGQTTRTSIPELLKIAQVGGQLGIAEKDIVPFTNAIDKLNVALGDEFTGGAEQITKEVGILGNIFQEFKGQAPDKVMLNIGNAINQLGASGAATGPVITDFATRIGGLAGNLGAGNILGISASLEELGVNAERGGSNVGRLVQKMSNPDTINDFAKAAGLTADEFTNLVNNSPNEALLILSENLVKNTDIATEFAGKLNDLKLDGVGVSEVLQKLGQNTELVRGRQKLANQTIGETNSILSEFEKKNNTSAAAVGKNANQILKLQEAAGKPSAEAFDKLGVAMAPYINGLADFIEKYPNVVLGFTGITTAVALLGTTIGGLKAIGILGEGGRLAGKIGSGLGQLGSKAISGALSPTGLGVISKAGVLGTAVVGSGLVAKSAIDNNFLGANDTLQEIQTGKIKNATVGGVAGGVTGALAGGSSGALAGAAIGSVVPVVGTLVGGIAGGIIGGTAGAIGGQGAGRGLGENFKEIKKYLEPGGELDQIMIKFFTGTVPENFNKGKTFITNWTSDRAKDFKNWFNSGKDSIGKFFSESIPSEFNKGKVFISNWTTDRAKEFETWLIDSSKNVGKFFTQDIPYALGQASVYVAKFFVEDIPKNIGYFVTLGIKSFGEFRDGLINKAIEIGIGVGKYFVEDLPKAVSKFVDDGNKSFEEFKTSVIEKTTQFGSFVIKTVTEDIPKGFEYFQTEASKAFNSTLDFGRKTFDQIRDWVRDRINDIGEFLTDIPSNTEKAFNQAKESATNTFNQIKSFIGDRINDISRFFNDIPGNAQKAFDSAFDSAKLAWEKIKNFIGQPITFAIDIFKNVTETVTKSFNQGQQDANKELGTNYFTSGRGPVALDPNRATGGTVFAGSRYTVNEEGSELFVTKDKMELLKGSSFLPSENGFILPHDISNKVLNSISNNFNKSTNQTNHQTNHFNLPSSSAGINGQISADIILESLNHLYKTA